MALIFSNLTIVIDILFNQAMPNFFTKIDKNLDICKRFSNIIVNEKDTVPICFYHY